MVVNLRKNWVYIMYIVKKMNLIDCYIFNYLLEFIYINFEFWNKINIKRYNF